MKTGTFWVSMPRAWIWIFRRCVSSGFPIFALAVLLPIRVVRSCRGHSKGWVTRFSATVIERFLRIRQLRGLFCRTTGIVIHNGEGNRYSIALHRCWSYWAWYRYCLFHPFLSGVQLALQYPWVGTCGRVIQLPCSNGGLLLYGLFALTMVVVFRF